MTKEAALLNANLILSLMVEFGSFRSVHFTIWNSGNECEVYAHYDSSKTSCSQLDSKFRPFIIEDVIREDKSVGDSDNWVYSFTWHWDD